jgi:S1-C subfamily serine protease
MSLVDVMIALLVFGALVDGALSGAIVLILSLAGLGLGLFVGAELAPVLSRSTTDQTMKAVITLLCVFGLGAVLAGIGRVVGSYAAGRVHTTPFGVVDTAVGAVAAVAGTLLAAWLVGNMMATIPARPVASAVQRSAILRFLDRWLPPAPPVIARIERLIDAGGLPQVFAQLEPHASPRLPLPASPVVQAAFLHAGASTVKIEGAACGGVQEGSGFVVAPGVVVTNAHVVAGMGQPYIVSNGTRSNATPVLFDPNVDIAVLRDPGVVAPPLRLAPADVPRGTEGAVVGYPGGGPLQARAAVVLAEIQALGRNIYGDATTQRSVYELEGTVRPGNSGGPLVKADGTVIGVVFARSALNNDIGYALTTPQVRSDINEGETRQAPTGTGPCTAG